MDLTRHKKIILPGVISLSGLVIIFFFLFLPLIYTTGMDRYWPFYLTLGLLSWLYGLYFGKNPYDNLAMQSQLILGALSLSISLIIAHRLHLLTLVLERSLPFMIFWFIGSIMATSLTRLLDEEKAMITQWTPLIAFVAITSLLGAALLGFILPYLMGFLQTPALLLLKLVEYILLLFAYGLSYMAQGLIYLLQILIQGRDVSFEAPEIAEPGPFFTEGHLVEGVQVSGDALSHLLLLILLFLTIAASIYLLLKQYQEKKVENGDELRESYGSLGTLKDWARLQWQELKESAYGKGQILSSLLKDYRTAVDIYQQLLKKTAKKGNEKPKSITAHRFQPMVYSSFPNNKCEANRILQAFSQELYQEEQLSKEHLLSLKEDLKKIGRDNGS